MNSNIFEVLSYGVIGLGFLLALLAFRLLTKEQSIQIPRENVLKSIYIFMLFSIILCVFGITAQLYPKEKISIGNGLTNFNEKRDLTNLELKEFWTGTIRDMPLNVENFKARNVYTINLHFKQDVNDKSRVTYTGTLNTYRDSLAGKTTLFVAEANFDGYGKVNEQFFSSYYDLYNSKVNGFGGMFLKFEPSGEAARGYCIFRDTKFDNTIGIAKIDLNLKQE